MTTCLICNKDFDGGTACFCHETGVCPACRAKVERCEAAESKAMESAIRVEDLAKRLAAAEADRDHAMDREETWRIRAVEAEGRLALIEVVEDVAWMTTPHVASASTTPQSQENPEKADAGSAFSPRTEKESDGPTRTNKAVSAGDTAYLVMAHRGGDMELHSYPIGVATSLRVAKEMKEAAEAYRGGKYSCSIWSFTADQTDMDVEPEVAVDCTPVPGWKSAAARVIECMRRDLELDQTKKNFAAVEARVKELEDTQTKFGAMMHDEMALADRLGEVLKFFMHAWATNWDCSATPGHPAMDEADNVARAALDEWRAARKEKP